MSKKILIVDDEDAIVMILKRILEKEGYQVLVADNGEYAQYLITLEKPGCIISDARMPKMSGIELLAWVKQNHTTPFVLMTGFSDLIETQKAHGLGLDKFITKPFQAAEILNVVKTCFGVELPKEHEKEVFTDEDFCSVSIDDFASGSGIPFNIYIRLSDHKFVRVAHSGADLEATRIRTYKDKGIHFLYLKKEDFRSYKAA